MDEYDADMMAKFREYEDNFEHAVSEICHGEDSSFLFNVDSNEMKNPTDLINLDNTDDLARVDFTETKDPTVLLLCRGKDPLTLFLCRGFETATYTQLTRLFQSEYDNWNERINKEKQDEQWLEGFAAESVDDTEISTEIMGRSEEFFEDGWDLCGKALKEFVRNGLEEQIRSDHVPKFTQSVWHEGWLILLHLDARIIRGTKEMQLRWLRSALAYNRWFHIFKSKKAYERGMRYELKLREIIVKRVAKKIKSLLSI